MSDDDIRRKNFAWNVREKGQTANTTDMNRQLAVLMDIRDELQKLNSLLHCHNFTSLPQVLRRMDRRLAKDRPLKKGRAKR